MLAAAGDKKGSVWRDRQIAKAMIKQGLPIRVFSESRILFQMNGPGLIKIL
jgi:hypothetical protein